MYKKILFIGLCLSALFACTEHNENPVIIPENKELPVLVMPRLAATKSIDYVGEDYFQIENYTNATISKVLGDKRDTSLYVYEESLSVFTAPDDASFLWFPLDGTTDSVKLEWPQLSLRKEVPADQRNRTAFLTADWLKGVKTDVSATTLLAMEMTHERSKITFTLEGDGLKGKNITNLIIGQDSQYQTYCDPDQIDAQFMVDEVMWELLKGDKTCIASVENFGNIVFTLKLPENYTPGVNYTIQIKK